MYALFPSILVLLSLAVVMAWLSIEHVREGQVAVLSRFRRAHRVLLPGAHFRIPLVDRVEHRLDTVGRSLEFSEHAIATGDQNWQVDGQVYYQILDPTAAGPELGNLEQTVTLALQHVLPALLPEHASASNDEFNQALKDSLNERLRRRGIMVARTRIQAA
ncbi:MAG: SPFH domain-containing protein [Xanthomonadales bacterium]|nr:SPFH domain-containing protein [Xanthomonadales bacterium]